MNKVNFRPGYTVRGIFKENLNFFWNILSKAFVFIDKLVIFHRKVIGNLTLL